jgi:hypothetical protein
MTELSGHYRGVLFDLLTALLDSWSRWNAVAGDADADAGPSRSRPRYFA